MTASASALRQRCRTVLQRAFGLAPDWRTLSSPEAARRWALPPRIKRRAP
jgi:hypothetical protein